MKAKYLVLTWILLAAMAVSAQTKKPAKTAYDGNRHNSYDRIHTVDGKKIEDIQVSRDDKMYRAEFVNEKMSELYVDDEKIPQSGWGEYSGAIAAIRVQMEINKQQAKANALQAQRNQEQDRANEEQAKRNSEQAVRNEIQAKKNAEQEARDGEQVKHSQKQDEVNKEQAKHNAEQAVRNEEQAKLNRGQEARNAEQAKLNAEQAAANERFMKEFTEDLVSDKIIPDANSLKEFRLDTEGMTVNGVKQPDELYKKYREKYSKQSQGFTYSRDGIIRNN
jgi:colicin import membrane protein